VTGTDASVWPVVGHQWAVDLLYPLTQIGSSGLRHAYLLLGPPQIGKSTLAWAFGSALLCTSPGLRPCGECRSCQLMAKAGHPDVRLVQPTDREGNVDRANGMLRVEAAEAIVHESMLRPLEGKYKYILIQDAHRANDSFSNKLLKTLEEPAPHVILCLTANDRADLLPTIVSRCQTLELRPLATELIAQALESRGVADPIEAQLLARLSNGRFGWALAQLQGKQNREKRQEDLRLLWQLTRANRVDRLTFSQSLSGNRENERLFGLLALWTGWWRDVLLTQAGCPDACNNIDHQAEIQHDAQSCTPADVQTFLYTLRRVEGYLHHTVNTALALDVLLLTLPRPVASR
jgi:DNA polymerase-3 subunit delta'